MDSKTHCDEEKMGKDNPSGIQNVAGDLQADFEMVSSPLVANWGPVVDEDCIDDFQEGFAAALDAESDVIWKYLRIVAPTGR